MTINRKIPQGSVITGASGTSITDGFSGRELRVKRRALERKKKKNSKKRNWR